MTTTRTCPGCRLEIATSTDIVPLPTGKCLVCSVVDAHHALWWLKWFAAWDIIGRWVFVSHAHRVRERLARSTH